METSMLVRNRTPIQLSDKPLEVRLIGCAHCHKPTLHVRPAVKHWLHFWLTLFTGIWLVVWVVITLMRSFAAFNCSECFRPRF